MQGIATAETTSTSVSPTLTIGITTYNRVSALRRAIESIETQDVARNDVEIVVIDDGSTAADAREYLNELAATRTSSDMYLRILWHTVGQGGPSEGRNEVLDLARGTYVMFLDDDNFLGDGTLSLLLKHLVDLPGDYFTLRRRRGERSFFYSTSGRAYSGLARTQVLWTFLSNGVFRTAWLRDIGARFDRGINYGEDNEFVMYSVIQGGKFCALSDLDYIIESDPGHGELPHISRKYKGVTFVNILTRHTARLLSIIEKAALDSEERRRLVLMVFARCIVSYRLPQKIVSLEELNESLQFLSGLMETFERVISDDEMRTWGIRHQRLEMVEAMITRDIPGLKKSFAS